MSDPLQNLDQLEDALADQGLKPALYRDMISRVRIHFRRYADLEIRLLGHVSFPVPHDVLHDASGPRDSEAIEELAQNQRERLRQTDPSAGNLMTALDRDGLKVYMTPFPDGPVDGFFLFDAEVGPAMTVRTGLSVPEANGVFARLLGHYLIDNDPYRICFSRPSAPTQAAAAEFGTAFLMGKRMLQAYLAALGDAVPSAPETVTQLAAYFETTPAMVVDRLIALGLVDTAAPPAPGELGETGSPRPKERRSVVSERFTRLALEAQARGVLTLKELAEHLETDEKAAQGLVDRFQLTASEDSGAD